MPSPRLQSKVALITGASSGIGAASALALAEEGAVVVLAARRGERLEAVAAEVAAAGGQALVRVTDVTDEAQAHGLVLDLLQAYGRLDILVNAAGVGVAAPFRATTPDQFREMVEVNLMGYLYCLNAVTPVMRRQGFGHIVVISSGAGRYFHPSVVYSGTKHAVSAIAESLRREVGQDGVRVTCIDPGAVDTEFVSHMPPSVQQAVATRLGDMAQLTATDVAGAVVYAVTQPERVNINILTIYPTEQA